MWHNFGQKSFFSRRLQTFCPVSVSLENYQQMKVLRLRKIQRSDLRVWKILRLSLPCLSRSLKSLMEKGGVWSSIQTIGAHPSPPSPSSLRKFFGLLFSCIFASQFSRSFGTHFFYCIFVDSFSPNWCDLQLTSLAGRGEGREVAHLWFKPICD